MKKLGLALILTALVAFAAVATASARSGGATTSSATSPQTSSHSGDSGPGEHGDGQHGDDSGHHGDDDDGNGRHHGDDDGDRREAGEDIRGNCDEAEHARDANCLATAASRTSSSSSATNLSSKSKRVAVGTKLVASVGPGFSIALKTAKGAAVKALRAGTYTVTVRDRSDEHNFRLSGKGFNKATSVGATATQTWRVQFKAGTYTFQCDPHAQVMRGTLRVS